MKKLILLLVLAAAALAPACATAQKIESKSSTIFREEAPKKKPANKWWALKLGGGITSGPSKEDDVISGAYNLSISYNRATSVPALYWGAQFGSSMLWLNNNGSGQSPTAFLGAKIGYMPGLSSTSKLDLHLGVNYELSFCDISHFVSPEIAIGVWFNRFYLGAQYNYALDVVDFEDSNSRVLINIGLRF